jgi:hypothetical protein
MAIEKVKPIPRQTARLDVAGMVRAHGITTTTQAVDYLLARFLRVPIDAAQRERLIRFLDSELGTGDLRAADSYMEDPLRMTVHLIMSMPEYQLG